MDARLQFLICVLSLTTFTLSNACPIGCTCAEHRVRCYGMQLQDIPENIPPDTIHLDLESNQIDDLDLRRISHLTELTELLLGYNHIAELRPGAFVALTKLTLINMDSNKLTSIPAGAFDGLYNLTSLYVTNNKIKTIVGAFRNLTGLKRMDIGRNAIEELTFETFEDLKNLIYLIMPNNNIKSVAENSFVPLQSLSQLDMSNNPLNVANELFSRNHRLSSINLSGCRLMEIPSGLPWATRHLQLGNNNITRIRKTAFFDTRYLGILILDENKITRIDKKVFAFARNMDQLWLNGNLLKKIPSPLPAKLSKLYMGKNRIVKLTPRDFSKNSRLTELVLNSNQIANIATNTFRQLKLLKTLNLKGNRLTVLQSDMFAQLGKLETLSVNKNKFTAIEAGALSGLVSLKKLEMAFIVDTDVAVQGNLFAATSSLQFLDVQLSPSIASQILASDSMISCLGKLTVMNLMDNELTVLSHNLQTYLTSIRSVKLAGNRWHCDKRLQWLSAWVRSKKTMFFKKDDVQCQTPKSLAGRPVWLLDPNEFAPVTSIVEPATVPVPDTSMAGTTPLPPGSTTSRPEARSTNRVMVTRTQRFFVFPSTTRSSRTAINRNLSTAFQPSSTKSTFVRKLSKKPPRYTKQTSLGSSTVAPTKMSVMSTYKTSTTKLKQGYDNSKVTNSTDVAVNWTPSTNTSKGNDSFSGDEGQTEAMSSSGATSMMTIIISTCVVAVVLLTIVAVAIFVTVRIRQNKLVYHRALQYRQDYSDVVFFVGEPVQDYIDTKLRVTRSRSDRASTSSRPSEDITNDLDNSMKVYTWDDN